MTIIQPYRNNYKSNFLISILILSSVGVALWGLFLYNQLVDLRHEITKQENDFSAAEVVNAELRNNLYSTIDVNNLETSDNTESLILDKNPEYKRLSQNFQPQVAER